MDLRDMFEEGDFDAPWKPTGDNFPFNGILPPEEIERLSDKLREMTVRHELAKEKFREEHKAKNFHWPEDSEIAHTTWKEGNLTFIICLIDRSEMYEGLPSELQDSNLIQKNHYNGYVRFPSNPFKKHEGYDGILTYVPVHGGLTFAEEDWDGSMVYGFDCAHAGDGERPELYDLVWLREHCEMMAKAITICAWYESKYLNTKTDSARAQVVDEMTTEIEKKIGLPFDFTDNFGAIISVLSGGPKTSDDRMAKTRKKRAELKKKLKEEE